MSARISIYDVDELAAATDGFTRLIGQGGCGQVFRGNLPSGEAVAVKRWTGVASVQGYESMMNEITTLARVTHAHLLPVLGFAYQRPGDLMLVSPYLARGSLHDALHRGAGATTPPPPPPPEELNAAWRISFLRQLASGISALHEARIVHRDVKSQNVLIGDDARAVLADAGIARRMQADADEAAAATGTRVIGGDALI